jgi:hypothetical protein
MGDPNPNRHCRKVMSPSVRPSGCYLQLQLRLLADRSTYLGIDGSIDPHRNEMYCAAEFEENHDTQCKKKKKNQI